MCDGVVPTDSSWSMSGYQESVGVHVDVHSQHVGFDLVSWCGPFRHTVLHHHEGPIILPQWPQAPFIVVFSRAWPAGVDSRVRTRSSWPVPGLAARPLLVRTLARNAATYRSRAVGAIRLSFTVAF